jgi:hypothetical protein
MFESLDSVGCRSLSSDFASNGGTMNKSEGDIWRGGGGG